MYSAWVRCVKSYREDGFKRLLDVRTRLRQAEIKMIITRPIHNSSHPHRSAASVFGVDRPILLSTQNGAAKPNSKFKPSRFTVSEHYNYYSTAHGKANSLNSSG